MDSKGTDASQGEMVIFGASGGIGQYLVRTFAKTMRVVGTYCRARQEDLAPGAEYWPVDMADRGAVRSFLADLAPGLKRPVLVYTPGISPNNLAHKFEDAEWDRTLEINLTGAFLACKGLLPRMREIGYGRIVLISSILARQGVPGTVAYSATKAGLGAMARVIAAENARKGITANTLALGYHDIGIIKAVPEPFLREKVLPSIPMGRLGDPAGIAAAIRFLIEADYMTGAMLDINGGMLAG